MTASPPARPAGRAPGPCRRGRAAGPKPKAGSGQGRRTWRPGRSECRTRRSARRRGPARTETSATTTSSASTRGGSASRSSACHSSGRCRGTSSASRGCSGLRCACGSEGKAAAWPRDARRGRRHARKALARGGVGAEERPGGCARARAGEGLCVGVARAPPRLSLSESAPGRGGSAGLRRWLVAAHSLPAPNNTFWVGEEKI